MATFGIFEVFCCIAATTQSTKLAEIQRFGGVAEWLNAPVLKSYNYSFATSKPQTH